MSMVEPEITVVIPSYNHASYVEEAVRSVLEQSFSNFELVVIDDGSTDDSPRLLDRLAVQDPRMKVVHQHNAGSHAALNKGVSLARAPWVAILNSDDVWHSDRLRTMMAEAQRNGGDFLFSDVQLIDSDGAPVTDPEHWWIDSIGKFRQRVAERGLHDGLLYGNLTVSTSNFLFKKELFAKVGPFRSYRYNLDWEFVLRCVFAEGVAVRFIPEPLLQYRLHGKNAILSGMPRAAVEAQIITRMLHKRHFGVSESLVLSSHRHDRLLRKFLSGRAARFEASFQEIEADRDRLSELLQERQTLIEGERAAHAGQLDAVRGDLTEMENSRDQLAGLLNERQAIIECERAAIENERSAMEKERADFGRDRADMGHERAGFAVELAAKNDELASARRECDDFYKRSVRISLDKEIALCREARLEQLFARHPERLGRIAIERLAGRWSSWRKGRSVAERSVASLFDEVNRPGVVRREELRASQEKLGAPRVAAHVHLYYKDLGPELFGKVSQVEGLTKVVVTGPWDRDSLEQDLGLLRETGADIHVVQVPNRGKDVGGLLHAIAEHALLDSDYVLKIHSKKSHNPVTYFQAISALFGIQIENGDQWRKLLIDPLAGNPERIKDILGRMESDRTIGMIGAAPFITTAPDANAELYARLSAEFGVPQGLPFVAGTMFWVRSALLAPLLDGAMNLNDFDLDSKAVEGGMEHIMERLFGAFVLSRGFDLLGVL